jgi:transcriptional regulator with XRE-family HTH domain
MSNKQQRLKEVYDYVRSNYPVHTQLDFAKEIKITRQAFSSAMNGNVSYLTTSLFQKICAAFPGTFNLDYLLTGEGELLLPQDASKVALTYQQSTPTDADMTHRILDMNAQIIADLRRDLDYFKQLVLDKDAIIQDNAEQIISLQSRLSAATNELEHTKNTLAAVRKNFDAKVAEVDQLKVELEKQRDSLARYPFTPGVADGDNDRTTITTDK